jgi:hypothetical protein
LAPFGTWRRSGLGAVRDFAPFGTSHLFAAATSDATENGRATIRTAACLREDRLGTFRTRHAAIRQTDRLSGGEQALSLTMETSSPN